MSDLLCVALLVLGLGDRVERCGADRPEPVHICRMGVVWRVWPHGRQADWQTPCVSRHPEIEARRLAERMEALVPAGEFPSP